VNIKTGLPASPIFGLMRFGFLAGAVIVHQISTCFRSSARIRHVEGNGLSRCVSHRSYSFKSLLAVLGFVPGLGFDWTLRPCSVRDAFTDWDETKSRHGAGIDPLSWQERSDRHKQLRVVDPADILSNDFQMYEAKKTSRLIQNNSTQQGQNHIKLTPNSSHLPVLSAFATLIITTVQNELRKQTLLDINLDIYSGEICDRDDLLALAKRRC